MFAQASPFNFCSCHPVCVCVCVCVCVRVHACMHACVRASLVLQVQTESSSGQHNRAEDKP